MRPAMTLLLLVLLVGCYGDAELPPLPAAEATPTVLVDRPTPEAAPSTQSFRMEQMSAVLERLGGSQDKAVTARDGAASWRPPELEKLHELLLACCQGNSATCRSCAESIAAAELPTEELWPLAGRFVGPLRPTAGAGLPPILLPLLRAEDGAVRDRALRLLVAAGAVDRGQPDAEGRRAAALPNQPSAGEPVWLIVERPAPCFEGVAELKGPDSSGRVDLSLAPDCVPEAESFPPKVRRLVWARRLEAMPASGLTLFAGEPDPLLKLARPPEKPEDVSSR